jgi:hypothetical protein
MIRFLNCSPKNIFLFSGVPGSPPRQQGRTSPEHPLDCALAHASGCHLPATTDKEPLTNRTKNPKKRTRFRTQFGPQLSIFPEQSHIFNPISVRLSPHQKERTERRHQQEHALPFPGTEKTMNDEQEMVAACIHRSSFSIHHFFPSSPPTAYRLPPTFPQNGTNVQIGNLASLHKHLPPRRPHAQHPEVRDLRGATASFTPSPAPSPHDPRSWIVAPETTKKGD